MSSMTHGGMHSSNRLAEEGTAVKRELSENQYDSGYAFWMDLVEQFGKRDAKAVANNYLECPMAPGDAEEEQFRRELRDAMEGH